VQIVYEIDATRLPIAGVHYAPGPWKCGCAVDSAYSCPSGALVRVHQCATQDGKIVDFQICRDSLGNPGEQAECRRIFTFSRDEFPQYLNNGNRDTACQC